MVAPKKQSKKKRHPVVIKFEHFIIGSVIAFIALIVLLLTGTTYSKISEYRRQQGLQPFYDTTAFSEYGKPGEALRTEELDLPLSNGNAQRILYRSQKADGSPTISSGMVFIPNAASDTPRPVVAWAHGTVGMGRECAPSRSTNPLNAISFVDQMLARGWIVVATDYAGLGTAGIQAYLVGGDESRDVINSVRAAREIPQSNASTNYAVWGHSQGGHSALFTAQAATTYAPELSLVGTVASAPASEIPELLNDSNNLLNWVIGSQVLVSWPANFPELTTESVTTKVGNNNYKKIANQCITNELFEAIARNEVRQEMFKTNPINNPAWKSVAESQTAPILQPGQPLLVAESLSDKIISPNVTALYIQNACNAKSNVATIWINNVTHMKIPSVIAPQTIDWIADRFAGRPNVSSCDQQLPITPAKNLN